MGIDIYLNGYDAWQERSRAARDKFDRMVAARDAGPKEGPEHEAAQKLVEAAADRMWAGSTGYLRSSYNSSGLFRVLEEIFGVDMAEYLFLGDWGAEPGVPVVGLEFVRKVDSLQRTAAVALMRKHLELPWTDVFSEVTGERAPDAGAASMARQGGESMGNSLMGLISGIGFDEVSPKPRKQSPQLISGHTWYITEGLKDLREFGELAAKLNAEGQKTFAYVSY